MSSWPEFRSLNGWRSLEVALVCSDHIFTGRQLSEAAARLAERLARAGVSPGHRVALLLGNTPHFVVSMLATMGHRASSVLLSTQFKEAEIRDAIQRTETSLVLSASSGAARLNAPDWELLDPDAAPLEGMGSLQLWRTGIKPVCAGDGELTVQFTSGVSGRSKFVPRTTGNLADELDNFSARLQLRAEDAILCPSPLFHTYGLVNGFLLPFFTGSPAILVDYFLPSDIVEMTCRYRPRVLVGVPAMYRALAGTYGASSADLASLRVCFSAGAPLLRSVFDQFRTRYGLDIHQQYGSTETGVIAINLQESEDADPLAVGQAIAGREIEIVEAEGEIKVRSGATAQTYLGDPALASQKFHEGWYYTGDVGKLAPNGDLFVTGRLSSFINFGGFKVNPKEVEAVLSEFEGVAECAVVGVPDPANGGEFVKAYVAGPTVSPKSLIHFCKRRLAPYKVPRQVEVVPRLPRGSTGKVLTKYLIGG